MNNELTLEHLDSEFASLALGRATLTPIYNSGAKMAGVSSKWRVISALQKAIRRGNVEQVQLTATALYNSGELDYAFRRLAVIALEDVSYGNLQLCAEVLSVASTKKSRKGVDELTLFIALATALAQGNKSRMLCVACVSAGYAPSTESYKNHVMGSTETDRLDIFAGLESGSLDEIKQGLPIVWHAMGHLMVDTPDGKRYAKPNPELVFYFFDKKGTGSIDLKLMIYILHKGIKLGGEVSGLASALILTAGHYRPKYQVITTIKEPVLIRGLSSESYDMHTSEGKRSYGLLAKRVPEFAGIAKEFALSATQEVSVTTLIGQAAFIDEGALVSAEYMNGYFLQVRKESWCAQAARAGVSEAGLNAARTLLKANFDKLHEARKSVILG